MLNVPIIYLHWFKLTGIVMIWIKICKHTLRNKCKRNNVKTNFNGFYNCHFSISLQKWNKITRDIWKSDSIFFIYKIVHYLIDVEIYFLVRFIIKGNWAHLSPKNSQQGSRINTIFRLSWKCINRFIIKTF